MKEQVILAEKLYYKKESNGNSRKKIHWIDLLNENDMRKSH